ncbi:HAD-IA family hydrolase [Rhizobium phaseoli]|uniref:HAD-IA family hydrolase n=1 Tax=Rhizobium phaseoli TaxID=396 RepID=UPI0035B7AAB7
MCRPRPGAGDPAPAYLAAKRLGFRAATCLVFDDVEAGAKAGQAAGADVVLVTAAGQDFPT